MNEPLSEDDEPPVEVDETLVEADEPLDEIDESPFEVDEPSESPSPRHEEMSASSNPPFLSRTD